MWQELNRAGTHIKYQSSIYRTPARIGHKVDPLSAEVPIAATKTTQLTLAATQCANSRRYQAAIQSNTTRQPSYPTVQSGGQGHPVLLVVLVELVEL